MVTIDIANSTLSTNVATDVGGGITTNGTVRLRNVTVANNSSSSDAPGGGAGLNAFGPGSYQMSNTLLAANTKQSMTGTVASNCGCSGGSATCAVGVMVSNGWNLEDANTCNFTVLDLVSADPMLSALANNGGVTETHYMASNSPVVDAGDVNACAALSIQIGDTDKRGTGCLRSVDGDNDTTAECDIGALEFVPAIQPALSSRIGGCAFNSYGRFDPLLPLLIVLSVFSLLWRQRKLRFKQD